MASVISKAKSLINEAKIFTSLENLKLDNDVPPLSSLVIEQLLRLRSASVSALEKFDTCESCTSFVWECLNTGHWSDVSLVWRKLFSLAMILKISAVLEIILANTNRMNLKLLAGDVIKMCDVALFMGSPIKSVGNLCSDMASLLSESLNDDTTSENNYGCQSKKPRMDYSIHLGKFSNITLLRYKEAPSLETFLKLKSNQTPALIRKAIDDWPALEEGGDHQWSTGYLKKTWLFELFQLAGYRTVPIELGKRYTDNNWTQKLMTIRDFVENYIETDYNGVGYLAQYQLFDQIPELRDDFEVPFYCYTESDDVDINCWIGPKGTVSPLHTDPKHNLLAQIVGSKHVILFPSDQSEYLHAFEDGILTNTSKINLEEDETEIVKYFPAYSNSRGFECILGPGDMLYIPQKCWHFVKSLETSLSINFWFE